MSREREFPGDAPSWEEMRLWFLASLSAFAVATAVSVVLHRVMHRLNGSLTLLASFFVLGWLGPNVFSSWMDRFLFTWPAALYAAFHATLWTIRSAERDPNRRWLARLVVVVFLLVGVAYFEACRAFDLSIGWGFLFGFLFAFPITNQAVRADLNRQSAGVVVVWTSFAFATYFWSCQVLFLLKGM